MSARSILVTTALCAWILASAVAFLIVVYTTFFGVAFIGLVICYVGAQFELDSDRPVASTLTTSLLGEQVRAQRDLPVEQRWSVRHEESLWSQSARFFKFFGLGLMVIGLCGGLYYQV